MILRFKKRHQGFALIEVILVLAIVISILGLGMRSYQTYQTDANIIQVKQNVAQIFGAMASYYHQNCNGMYSESGIQPGTLNPVNGYPSVYSVNLTNDLINTGLLASTPSDIIPILSAKNSTGHAYVVQFNSSPTTSQTQQVCVQADSGICTQYANVGTVYVWEAQVSVMLNVSSLAAANAYLGALGGDCLSSFNTQTGSIAPCSSNGPNNNYQNGYFVVWQRPPSVGLGGTLSSFWQINPIVRNFYLMTTTPSQAYQLGPNGSQTTYLCSG